MNTSDQLTSDYNEEVRKKNNLKWQDILIDLVVLENKLCPQEKACYLNNILAFVEKEIERKLAEQRTTLKEKIEGMKVKWDDDINGAVIDKEEVLKLLDHPRQ